MKGCIVALDHLNDRQAAALIVDGKLDDFLVEPGPDMGPVPGTIFRAICDRPLKGQGGMILRLPGGNGFLRQGKNLAPGQEIMVQVSGFAEAHKAIPVSRKIVFKSRYIIVTPGAPGINISRRIQEDGEKLRIMDAICAAPLSGLDFGIIARSQSTDATDEEITADVVAMLEVATNVMSDESPAPYLLMKGANPHQWGWREWQKPDIIARHDGSFEEHGILDQIDALAVAKVSLKGGAVIFIEPTRALVAVDVNTGADTSMAAGLKANLACAHELPRQLRLRGLGGQITLDLAPMPKKDRKQFENALRSALRQDPVETALVGWTPLGHYELQRKRERLPIRESLST